MSINKTRSLKWLIPLILLGTSGVAVWQGTKWLEPPAAEPSQEVETPPRPVETVKLTSGEAVRKIQLLGQVEASEQATIRTQVDGLVKQVLVKVGDRLNQNQTVAIIDDSDQKLQVEQASARLAQEKSILAELEIGTRSEIIDQRQAELNGAKAREQEAQDNLNRIRTLTQKGALSERELVQAQAEAEATLNERLRLEAILTEAQAGPTKEEIDTQRAIVEASEVALQQAQLDLERTKITADFTGVVQTKEVSAGDYVESSDPLITLVSGDKIDIFLEVPEQLIGQIQPGQIVEITTRSHPNWKQQAEIEAVVLGTEAATRRQIVRSSLTERSKGPLLPGMAIQGSLEIPVTTEETVFIITRDALTRREDQWLVFAVELDKVKEYPVELITDMGETVAITNRDLKAGQEIVTAGGDGLREGVSVKIVNRK